MRRPGPVSFERNVLVCDLHDDRRGYKQEDTGADWTILSAATKSSVVSFRLDRDPNAGKGGNSAQVIDIAWTIILEMPIVAIS